MYFGIDVGGTSIRVAGYEDLGTTAECNRRQLVAERDFVVDFRRIVRAIQDLASFHQSTVDGIGIGIAGKLDSDRTTLTGAGNLKRWVGQPIKERFTRDFGCQVVLGNDAEAPAMAEAIHGHGKNSNEDFFFIIWGTGFGGCLVRQIDGKVELFPGEPGHQTIPNGGIARCGCEATDCLEAHVGGNGIALNRGKPAEELSETEWLEVMKFLCIGVHNIVTITSVPLVVFGGGIASKQQRRLVEVREYLASSLKVVDPPDVKLSVFGEDAGCVGALSLLSL